MLSEPQNTSVIRKATVASSPLAKETSFMSHKGGGSVSCTVNSQRKIPILSKKHFFIPILFRYLLFRHYLIVILISILGYTNILKFITAFQRSGLITKVATGSFLRFRLLHKYSFLSDYKSNHRKSKYCRLRYTRHNTPPHNIPNHPKYLLERHR